VALRRVIPTRRRLAACLSNFVPAQLSLSQAMAIAEGLHRGSRTATIGFEISNSPGYRVRTVTNGEIWENFIDANTGGVKGAEITSSLLELDGEDRVNIIALKSVRQELSDAVRVAEKAASGIALGGGLVKQDGKLNFVVVIVSGDGLKEVMLEPSLSELPPSLFELRRDAVGGRGRRKSSSQ
jgi:hypothetical protein